jgi:hypothetical protein
LWYMAMLLWGINNESSLRRSDRTNLMQVKVGARFLA